MDRHEDGRSPKAWLLHLFPGSRNRAVTTSKQIQRENPTALVEIKKNRAVPRRLVPVRVSQTLDRNLNLLADENTPHRQDGHRLGNNSGKLSRDDCSGVVAAEAMLLKRGEWPKRTLSVSLLYISHRLAALVTKSPAIWAPHRYSQGHSGDFLGSGSMTTADRFSDDGPQPCFRAIGFACVLAIRISPM